MGDILSLGHTSLQLPAAAPVAPADAPRREHTGIPLCVDLDGTLVKTDLLLESWLKLVKQNPAYTFVSLAWLLRGKAYFKAQIARRVTLDAASLPYHTEFLHFLTEQHRAGRPLVLATACDRALARRVAQHLGLFAEVIASDGRRNLSGRNKLKALQARYGRAKFDYAGNSRVDFPIWRYAHRAILVNAPHRVVARAAHLLPQAQVFPALPTATSRLRTVRKAMRLHQWVKNLLVFLPLLAAHKIADVPLLSTAVVAFLAFSLCSSAVYLVNDLLDLESDRLHPTKRRRPFASGDLPIAAGLLLAPLLLAGSAALALLLPLAFLLLLGGYFALTLAYSLYLKQIVLLDALTLAGLYTSRIMAGAAAVGLMVSHWLLAFSLFLFLSLAFVKRFSELHALRLSNQAEAHGRGYLAADLEQLASLGAASGYIAVLVLALYINSPDITVLYRHPQLLWLICPLLLYWISRIWLLAHRGRMDQDPIVFALHDKVSYLAGIGIGVITLLSI